MLLLMHRIDLYGPFSKYWTFFILFYSSILNIKFYIHVNSPTWTEENQSSARSAFSLRNDWYSLKMSYYQALSMCNWFIVFCSVVTKSDLLSTYLPLFRKEICLHGRTLSALYFSLSNEDSRASSIPVHHCCCEH